MNGIYLPLLSIKKQSVSDVVRYIRVKSIFEIGEGDMILVEGSIRD